MACILVVDDEPDIVRFAVSVLKERGHQVITAVDGPSAITKAHGEHPDVILIDLRLPQMDGRQVCQELKRSEQTQMIPIVMMTATSVSIEDIESAAALGADDYLLKPFLRDVLIHNIERHLKSTES